MENVANNIAVVSSDKTRRSINHKCGVPCRYTLSILACLGFTVVYALRANLSVALVVMVNSTDLDSRTRDYEDTKLLEGSQSKKFNWNEETQGVILSSFFYGYLITQIPGGWLASRFGGKHLFGLGVLCTSVFTLLTPWAAGQGVGVLVAVRVIEGLGEGVTFPAVQELFSSWAPPLERCTMYNIALAGISLGNIISQQISGILCASSFLGGWPSVFYIFGSFGIIWYISWILLVFEKPTTHPRISPEEKEYIVTTIGASQDKLVKKHPIPWSSIIKSPAVYAFVIEIFCSSWCYYTLLTALPSYCKDVLGFGILQDGFMSSIPYIIGFFTSLLCFYGDFLVSKKFVSVTEIRKISAVGACVIPGCLLLATSFVGREGRTLAIVLISLAVGFDGLSLVTVNSLDIAPRFAGLLTGISNTFGTTSGIISPLVTGWLTNNKPTRHQWQKVFYISAAIWVIGGISFALLGSGKEQPWNTPEDERFQEVDIVRDPRKPLLYPSDDNSAQTTQSINRI